MVYIASWKEFQEAAENLYEKSPNSVCFLSSFYRLFACADVGVADSVLCKMEVGRGKARLEDHR